MPGVMWIISANTHAAHWVMKLLEEELSRRLTVEQRASYRQDGVLFPLPALSPEEVAECLRCIEDLRQAHGGNPKSHELSQCHLHFEWARRLVMHPAILDAVEDVIGPDILVHATSIFQKRPYDGTYVSWHQDGYYMRLDRPDFVSAWVALTDSTRENGCLRVVKGSHLSGSLVHSDSAVAERNLLSSGLEIAVQVDESAATDEVLRAGEMSFHHVNMVHGSNPNLSGFHRTGFAIRYVAPHVKQASPHHPVLLARGKDRYGCFDLQTSFPLADFAQAVAAQRRFSADLRARRQAQGRRG
jgi:non-heme Fe2+,alpha-ketoglutarate-dependent halogenase